MALVVKDRVQETTTTTGTGTYTLAGAVTGYQTFAAVGDGNTTYYAATNGTDWEIGIGTYTASGTTLARTTIIASTNSNNAVDWAAGTKNVFVTYPASRAVTTTDVQTLSAKTVTGLLETKVAVAASDIDLSVGNWFTKTISGTTTFTVSNVPASGTTGSFILDLTNGGSATINWWTGTKWAGGTAPTLTASGRDVLGFYTYDGGTTWTGLVLGKDVK